MGTCTCEFVIRTCYGTAVYMYEFAHRYLYQKSWVHVLRVSGSTSL